MSGSEMRSTAPAAKAFSAFWGAPDTIQFSAKLKPANLGNRTVPPQPGIMPSPVSGNPMEALDEITRLSQLRHISKPPPRAKPLIAATEG